ARSVSLSATVPMPTGSSRTPRSLDREARRRHRHRIHLRRCPPPWRPRRACLPVPVPMHAALDRLGGGGGGIMRTLYVSDLDGTLLGTDQRLSDASRSIINDLVAEGMLFTVATGRSLPPTELVLRGLDLRLPIICMN